MSLRLPAVVPPALARGKLTIELPISDLDEQEIAQITSWLRGRATSITVRRNRRDRLADAVHSAVKNARKRVLSAFRAALVWTLARVSTTPSER